MTETRPEAPVAREPANFPNGGPAESPAPVVAPRLTMLEGMEVIFDAKVGLQPIRLIQEDSQ